jgi:spore coat polysaccharide biosynthesis protein SpsF
MRAGVGIVLQARWGSTRLPGKALAPIGRYSLLEHCLRRMVSAGVAPVVLATTTREEDTPLADLARSCGAYAFRGSEHDVLGRYVDAAAHFGFRTVVRATGDNPAVDVQAPGRVIALIESTYADYAVESGLPYGAGVEAMNVEAMRHAAALATDPSDREHVRTYLTSNPSRFRLAEAPAPAPLRRPDLRFTVDTGGDLEYVRTLFARTGQDEPSLRRLIEVAGRAAHRKVA